MPAMDTEQLLARLGELEPDILSRYKVKEIGLFGSFVRGEYATASDIDMLVDFN
jgi:predicted nucleotidyltransferase